jgi:hypothetical protein
MAGHPSDSARRWASVVLPAAMGPLTIISVGGELTKQPLRQARDFDFRAGEHGGDRIRYPAVLR